MCRLEVETLELEWSGYDDSGLDYRTKSTRQHTEDQIKSSCGAEVSSSRRFMQVGDLIKCFGGEDVDMESGIHEKTVRYGWQNMVGVDRRENIGCFYVYILLYSWSWDTLGS